MKNAPTRKSDLIEVIVRTLNTPETLQRLWSQLDELSRQTLAAAIEHGGELNEDAFRAQYHVLPWDAQKKTDSLWSYSYRREYLPIDVFIYYGRIPPDAIPLLKPLAPQLTAYAVEALAELPAAEAEELYRVRSLLVSVSFRKIDAVMFGIVAHHDQIEDRQTAVFIRERATLVGFGAELAKEAFE